MRSRIKHRIYWTLDQFNAIKDLVTDKDYYVRTPRGLKRRPAPRPRLSDEEKWLLKADPEAGKARISGQWVCLQYQLGKEPYGWNTIENEAATLELHIEKRQKPKWNVGFAGGKFLVYQNLPDDSPQAGGRDTSEFGTMVKRDIFSEAALMEKLNKPSRENRTTQLLEGRQETSALVPTPLSQKLVVPGVAPGKGALVYDALYETIKAGGWSSDVVERLERMKVAITHPHQVCLVLKKLNSPSLSLKLFTWTKSIPGFKHDIVNYSTMIMILGDNGDVSMAEELFKEMQEQGIQPDTFAINNLIRCYVKMNKMEQALDLYRKMRYFGCQADSCTFGLLINFCGKFGLKKELQRLFLDLRATPGKADAQTFNSMIYNFSKQRDFLNASEAANQMRKWGISYTVVTYATTINMYGRAQNPQAAADLFAEYCSSGLEPSLIVYNNAVFSLGTNGRLKEAEQVIEDIGKAGLVPDKYTYCTIISSWARGARAGDAKAAKGWFDKAVGNGVSPTIEMCNALIDGFLKAKDVPSVQYLMSTLMPSWGLKPTLQTYTILFMNYTDAKRMDSKLVRDLMQRTDEPVNELVTKVLDGLCAIKELRHYAKSFFERIRIEKPPRWGRSLADALVHHLHVFGYAREAYYVWEGVSSTALFPRGIWEEWQDAWFIWLQNMNTGTALVALSNGLIISKKKLKRGFERPMKVIIICGYQTEKSKLVTDVVDSFLKTLNSPFEPFISLGRFMCEGNLFRDWLWEPQVERDLKFTE